MSTENASPPAVQASAIARVGDAVRVVCRGLLESLPGQLLLLTVGFVAISLVLVYFPAAASFRVQWMTDRAEAAHLAALAADVAPGGGLGEQEVRSLLMGADAVAVSRVRNGMNELVLYSGPIGEDLIESDLRTASWMSHIRDTTETLFAPSGRLLRIRAIPRARPDEVIDVIVTEAPLRAALAAFSRRLLFYSVIIAIAAGGLIYLSLFFLFVRPMRKLAGAMIRFRAAPEDPSHTVIPGGGTNEIAQAEDELARMQDEIRQALKQRERLAALGGAVARINHDLRNVLTSAQLVSDRLAMDSDPRVRGMGQRLVRAVDRGVRLCQVTLEYGSADESPPARQRVELADLLDEVAGDAMLSEGEVDWSNEVDPELVLDVDPDQTHRIFLNLFRNAIQAMKSAEGRQSLTVVASSEVDFLILQVSDTGPGLPDRARDKLFEAFSGSTRKGGTGLGLSIARELARGHGGDINLVQTGADGTIFAVSLPAANDDEA
jgi:signal transduction histidine kinase